MQVGWESHDSPLRLNRWRHSMLGWECLIIFSASDLMWDTVEHNYQQAAAASSGQPRAVVVLFSVAQESNVDLFEGQWDKRRHGNAFCNSLKSWTRNVSGKGKKTRPCMIKENGITCTMGYSWLRELSWKIKKKPFETLNFVQWCMKLKL